MRAQTEPDDKLGEGIMSPTLFSYCIPYDDGAAPNPFWGLCTLAICKPIIRRVANIGDWIVGTGSVNSPIRDISGKVVYAMRVTQKKTMGEYVLLSDHFFYFGDQPVALPEELRAIAQQQQGHRSRLNVPYVHAFVRWIESLKYPCAVPIGNPQWWSLPNVQASCAACATGQRQEDEADLAED